MATAKIRSAIGARPKELCPDLPRGFKLPDGQQCFLCLVEAEDLSERAEDTLYDRFDKNMFEMSAGTSMTYTPSSKRQELFDVMGRFLLATTSPVTPGISEPPTPADPPPASHCVSGESRKGIVKGKAKARRPTVDVTPDQLLGFCSFRFDTEETMTSRDAEVVYCYELQLALKARGLGLGKVLMDELEALGRRRRLDKVMLTCLSNNHPALKFYAKQGYEADEIDPTRVTEEAGEETWEDGDEDDIAYEGEEGSEGAMDYRILSKSLVED